MKIVIDIPEAKLMALQIGEKQGVGMGTLERAVLDGTPLPEGYDSIKMVTNAEEAEKYPISEDISKSFEKFTEMMFK